MVKRCVLLVGAVFVGASLLAGCGAVNSAINNNIPAADNALGLDGATIVIPVTGSRAPISGSASQTVTFGDRSFSQQDKLHKAKFEQFFENTTLVVVPVGKSLPAEFTVSNMTFQVTVSDGSGNNLRSASFDATYAGPVTYVRSGSTNQYVTQKLVGYSNVEISGDTFKRFRDISTSSPSPNSVTSKLSLDTDDTALPKGSNIAFKFSNGKVRVGI